MGMFKSDLSSANVLYSPWRVGASIAENGSSRSRILGCLASALASATRCCCPPDSWLGMRSARLAIPIRSSKSMLIALRSDLLR